MRLTRVLSIYWPKRRLIPGLQTAGKRQKVAALQPEWKASAIKWMFMEQQNMEILSKPFVKIDEEKLYDALPSVQWKKQQLVIEQRNAEKAARMPKHYTTEEHLEHLNVNKKWE